MALSTAALVSVTVLACRDKAYTKTSAAVTAPPGSRYSRATASIDFAPRRHGGHSTRSEQVTLRLTLDSAVGPRTLTLDELLAPEPFSGSARRPGDSPPALYRQMQDPKFALAFAPDGHALALSVDGGKQYRVVLLDTPDPLYCAHITFSLGGGWAAAPKTRDIVLALLASTDPPSGSTSHLEHGEHPRGRERFLREFRGAMAYAKASPDPAVQQALLAALVRPKSPIEYSADINALAAAVSELIQRQPKLEADVVRALEAAPSIEERSRAALSLADSKDPTVEDALAKALAALGPLCSDSSASCGTQQTIRSDVTWALAKVCTSIGTLSAGARDALLTSSTSSRDTTRAYAARGLAVDRDPRALGRLRELAKEPCRSELASVPRQFPPLLPYLVSDPLGPGCSARAALARHR